MKRDDSSRGALAELADQHGRLRDMMERCEELADALDSGTAEPGPLLREVARLRSAFDAHNRFEEQLLRPALLDADWREDSRLVEDHVAEHRTMGRQLGSTTTTDLRAVIASLRAHLQAEERSFLSGKIVRDDPRQ